MAEGSIENLMNRFDPTANVPVDSALAALAQDDVDLPAKLVCEVLSEMPGMSAEDVAPKSRRQLKE